MRPVLHGDVSSAARALYRVDPARRADLCQRMLAEAERADSYVRSTGRAHPEFGNGSLMAAARKRVLAPEPGFDNARYCACFALVLAALIDRALPQPEAQPTHRTAARSRSSRLRGMSSPQPSQ